MASYPIENAPADLSMIDFKAISDDFGGLVKSNRFAVRIGVPRFGVSYSNFVRNLTYLCEIAEMPGRGFMNVDVRYYGPNQKLPYNTQYEDITLTFLCRNEAFERQFFDDWMNWINPVNTFDFNYRDEYSVEIDIFQYTDVDEDDTDTPTPKYNVTLRDAYPILVNPQAMTWSDDQFQRLSVTFTYTKWIRKNYDPAPRNTGPQGFSFDLVEGRQVVPRV